MTENYEHSISRNINAYYKRRLLPPILYLALLAALWFLFPLADMLRPSVMYTADSFKAAYETKSRYVQTTFTNLKFSGYTSERFGHTIGYYYYTLRDSQCVIVLLSPRTCEEGLPEIRGLTVTGKLVRGRNAYRTLLNSLAEDLDWTPNGIANQISSYYFSEPDFHTTATTALFALYFGSMAYALLFLLLCLLFIRFPALSPACQSLAVFGHPKRILEEAEEELATLPQLATEDLFITEHYFIMTSPVANAIVPIQEILWIYKHSTLHKFLWYHFSISYTMHIVAGSHLHVHCPKNTKSDIDGIIDYLAEANHDILVGFSEENRLKVQAVQGRQKPSRRPADRP